VVAGDLRLLVRALAGTKDGVCGGGEWCKKVECKVLDENGLCAVWFRMKFLLPDIQHSGGYLAWI
jgi:hypothetical protein